MTANRFEAIRTQKNEVQEHEPKKKAEKQPVVEEQLDLERTLEYVSEINPEALYPTDMKEAVIGIVERYGLEPLVLMDKTKCLKILEKDGMSEEEADEFFQYNTIGAWMGDGTPCFATLNKDIF